MLASLVSRFTLPAMLVAALCSVAQSGLMAQDAQQTPTVALLDFTGSALGRYADDYAALGSGIPHHLGYVLARNPSIRLVDRHRIQEIIREQDLGTAGRIEQETLVRVGKILGAHHILHGSFIVQSDGAMSISVSSTNTETSQVEYSEQVRGRADKVIDLLDQLAARLDAGLKLPAIPSNAPRPAVTSSTSIDQNKLILLEGAALKAEDRGDVKGAIELWKQVMAISPNYEGARVRVAKLDPPR